MKNMGLAGKILALVAVCVGVAAISSIALLYQMSSIAGAYSSLISREITARDSARLVEVAFKTEVQEWKNTLLRGHKPEDLKKYGDSFHSEQARVRAETARLKSLLRDEAAITLAKDFDSAHEQLAGEYETALAAFAQGLGQDAAQADTMVRGKDRASIEFLRKLGDMIGQQVDEAVAAESTRVAATRWWSVIVLLVVFAVVVGVSIVLVRTTTAPVKAISQELLEGSDQVLAGASQVADSAQGLSQGASEQAASLEETSASMEEMASMTRKNAENAQAAASLTKDVDRQVVESNQSLEELVVSMSSIQDSSSKVSKIIKTIDEIAFQTNILALNAAVEAARAGEAGMGFAVVAEEVRNLAQRSAQASKDTAALIEQAGDSAHEGSEKLEAVASAFRGITESVAKVKGLVEEVSIASRQQTQGIEQVSQAVAQMEKVTQSNAANAEESAAASEELSAQAQTATAAIGRLRTLIVGQSASVPMANLARLTKSKAGPGMRRAGTPGAVKPRLVTRTPEEEIPMAEPATGTFGSF